MPTERKRQYRHMPAFILLALAEKPIHGGAIHTALIEKMPLYKPDTPAIYRTLKQLEKDGEVESRWDTAHTGPAIKIYSLTPIGWDKLEYWKRDIEMRLANLTYFLTTYETLTHRDES